MIKATSGKPRFGICPVCVEEKPLTRDHVPPRGIFLKPRPANTITVWTCAECNGGSKLDDEYFRVYIAAEAEAKPGSHLYRLWKEKVVESTFKRSPSLRATLREDMDRIRKRHKDEPLRDFNGRILTDEEVERVLPLQKERIDRVVHKTVRCLHAYHEATPLPKKARLETSVEPLNGNELEVLIRDRTGMVGGENGEFIYHYVSSREGELWVLFFYLTRHLRVKVSNP